MEILKHWYVRWEGTCPSSQVGPLNNVELMRWKLPIIGIIDKQMGTLNSIYFATYYRKKVTEMVISLKDADSNS